MYLLLFVDDGPFYQTSTFTHTLTTGSKTWNPSGLRNGIYRYIKYVQRLWEWIWWHLSFWSFAWFQALLIQIWDDDLMFSEWVAQPAHLGASNERVFSPSGLHTTARRPRSSLGGWPKGTNSLAGRRCPGFPEFIPIISHLYSCKTSHRLDSWGNSSSQTVWCQSCLQQEGKCTQTRTFLQDLTNMYKIIKESK